MYELLTPAAMAQADQITIARGVRGVTLMERAGRAVADALRAVQPSRVLVLCGPGNNGGDGYVAARHLQGYGVAVTVAAAQPPSRGDAVAAARSWSGPVSALQGLDFSAFDWVIDGLFGAGLARAPEGIYAEVIQALNQSGRPVLAIDMPSGVEGGSGAVWGEAVHAQLTVSFFRAKPGHYLYPGRGKCGELKIVDIGIAADVLSEINSPLALNVPDLWLQNWPYPAENSHKYNRGHVWVGAGGLEQGGAARLAARAALRSGAGLVTLSCPREALSAQASALQAVMVRGCDGLEDWARLLADQRRTVVVIGPGLGINPDETPLIRAMIAQTVQAGRKLVLDAGALTAFAGEADKLKACLAHPAALAGGCVITPHEGEFARLFQAETSILELESKAERARAAAVFLNCVVVLKGADTVIASPDGRMIIQAKAPVWLATAGSGDLLAGIIAAFLAQGVRADFAASMAVYVHSLAGERGGAYLIADDLPDLLQPCLQDLAALYRTTILCR